MQSHDNSSIPYAKLTNGFLRHTITSGSTSVGIPSRQEIIARIVSRQKKRSTSHAQMFSTENTPHEKSLREPTYRERESSTNLQSKVSREYQQDYSGVAVNYQKPLKNMMSTGPFLADFRRKKESPTPPAGFGMDFDMHDVLFSQVSIRFPKPGQEGSSSVGDHPTVYRKVLMGSDFTRLIQEGRGRRVNHHHKFPQLNGNMTKTTRPSVN